MARRAADAPALSPKDGLRQRQRADGSWRLWWEPTARQREAGAQPVEFQPRHAGHAQREATRLARDWNARVAGKPVEEARRDGRSVSSLIQDYRASRHFTRLRDTTQKSYATDLRAIEAKWGPQPVALFDAPMIDAWADALSAKMGQGRARVILGMMSTLMAHAERRGWRPRGSNPARDLQLDRYQKRSRRGTWAELDALLSAARALERQARGADLRISWRGIRLAILLTALGGQRQTDVRLARPGDFSSVVLQLPGMNAPRRLWIWSLTRSKRLNEGALALHPLIVPVLRAQLRIAGDGPGTLIWDAVTGKAYATKDLFWDRWNAVRALAAKDLPSVASIQWRDLRRTFGGLARAGGADKGDVADVLGNTADQDDGLGLVYMAPQLATTWRAASAITRPAQVEPTAKARRKA